MKTTKKNPTLSDEWEVCAQPIPKIMKLPKPRHGHAKKSLLFCGIAVAQAANQIVSLAA